MRKEFQRLVLAGVLVLSAAIAGAVLSALVLPETTLGAACGQCNVIELTCPNSNCNCEFDEYAPSYYICAPPVK